MHSFLKLLYEWWLQLWPNMFAVSVWTSLMFIWHHRSLKKHISNSTNGVDLTKVRSEAYTSGFAIGARLGFEYGKYWSSRNSKDSAKQSE